jgi:homoprotocatechuate degradation regulator HpaR
MDQPPLPPDMPRVLREALEALVAPFRPILAAHGLTEQQWRVLRALRAGVDSQVELAAACVMHPASLSGVLGRMERDGLIARRRSTVDQRRVIVTTAPRGDALLAAIAPEIAARYAALGDSVGPDVLQALGRAGAALRDAARSATE